MEAKSEVFIRGCLCVLGFWEGDVNALGLSVLLRASPESETLRFERW
jgi:hypothetical protein